MLFLLISFVWTTVAQHQMKNSWRMGIDPNTKTKLVKNGLFQFSRNPIFLGLIVSFLGLFLTTPNGITLILLIIGSLLIQIQTRLEEDFLSKQLKAEYTLYKQKTRRFI